MSMKVENEEMSNDLRGLLSEKEAAKILGVCRLTMLHLRQRGALSFYRVGRTIRYSMVEHIEPFLERHHFNRKRKSAIRAD
jgi:excisionase family DNA binding protein